MQLLDVGYQPPEAERADPRRGSTSTSRRARRWPSSGAPARASRRCFACWPACSSRPRAPSSFDRTDSQRLRYGDLRQTGRLRPPGSRTCSPPPSRDNIALGDDPPDADAVRWAAEVADLAELVDRLPLGYDTPVGDRGLPLSGGQAQRLAIARALYRKPPVLLFDEATSALDTESESIVKRNIDRLLEGRTAFVVAHRLSTIRNADVIVVLERGRLVEKGSHDELLARKGVYFYLYTQQLSD